MARRPRNDTRLAFGMVAAVILAAFAGWVLMPDSVPSWVPTPNPLRERTSAKATPKLMPPPTAQIEADQVASGTAPLTTLPVQTIPPGGVFFVDCATVRAAGAVLRRGDAGYRPGLDRDGDGVACESTAPAAPSRPVVVVAQSTTPTASRPGAATLPTSAPPPPPPSALLLSVATTAPPPPPTATTARPAPVDVDGAPTIPPPPPATSQPAPPPVYGSCDDAAANGRVPLRPGQAGWNAALDVDGDGLACEDDSATLPTTPSPVPVLSGADSTTTTATATSGDGR